MRPAIGAVSIDQGRAASDRHRADRADEDVMRADPLGRDNAAVEGDDGVRQARRTGVRGEPRALRELVAIAELAAAAEMVGQISLIVTQDVDAEHAVLDDGRRRLALVM